MAKKIIISDFSALKGKVTFSVKGSDVKVERAGAGTGGGFIMEAVLHKGFGILQFHL